ncbi:uncharacterized protein [Diadema antillarum]|uniref:uncharacterized protein n=1 Tax=Diadema antillarum TaxID=105358 RepID=UPI003A899654
MPTASVNGIKVVVTTVDSTAPVVSNCPADISLLVNNLGDTTTATWIEPTATDNTGLAVSVIQSHTPGDSFEIGFTGVTYVFRDSVNNVNICNFVVRVGLVGDATAPVISNCPADFTIFVPTSGSTGTPTWTAPTATDDTGVTQFTANLSPLTSLPVGTFTVTYTFEDPSGNEATCSFAVTVAVGTPDTTVPIVTFCPSDIVRANGGQNFVLVTWDVPVVVDDSGVVNQLSGPSSNSQFYAAGTTNTISYQFYDPSGNRADCSFTATVTASSDGDTTPPVITGCPADINLEIPSIALTSVSISWTEPTATDDSGSVSSVSTHQPGDSFDVGTSTTVSYTFSDDAGNTATCSFDVVITSAATLDTTPPVIDGCPSNIAIEAVNGASDVSVTWIEPTATDDSGSVSLTQTAIPGDIFPLGSTEVTYTFSDPSGNSATCSFSVVVSGIGDTISPVITGCPSDINLDLPSDFLSDVSVTWIEPTATDDSGSVSLTQTAIPGDIFPLGSTEVTYTFSDPSGNSATCSFSVVVSGMLASGDTISPVITGCPSDINLDLPSDFLSSVSVSWTEPTATDDSGFVSSTSTHQPGDIFDVGSQTTVVYTFSDSAGNTAICAFDVIVSSATPLDTTPPVIDGCPSDIAIEAADGASDVSVTWIEPTATDDSGSVSLTQTAIPGDSFPLGSTEVTYTFSDPSGNSATCSFSVVVSGIGDTISPVITGCPSDINLDLPSDFLSSVSVSWTEPTATDDSGFVSSTSTHQPGDIFDVGSQTTVTYTFSDEAGNTAICAFDVIISSATPLDTTPPVIDGCPSGIAIEAANGASDVSVTWVEPTATDDSGSVSLTQTAIPGDIFPLGSTEVTYTFSDPSGNSAACSFSVVVSASTTSDTTSPVITGCPSDINIEIPSASITTISVTWTEPTATDDSGSVTSSSTHQPGDSFALGSSTTVVYTFSDSAGNTAACSFDVVLTATTDTTPPVVSGCPSDITVEAIFGSSDVSVTWPEPTATDDSGSVSSTQTAIPGDQFPFGSTEVIYTFADPSGNTAACLFNVIVSAIPDEFAPVVEGCPADIVVEAVVGSSDVPVNWTDPTATDNSGTLTQTQTARPGDTFHFGSTNVVYTFTDMSGNSASCSFTVVVSATIDNTAPVISNCPSDISVSIASGSSGVAVTWTVPTATDNSGSVSSSSTANPGDFFPVGTTTVSYTFTDGSGNSAVCSFDVTVAATIDNTAPVISNCPSDISVSIASGSAGVAVTWTVPTATDNSGSVSSTSTANPGDFFPVGTTTVSYIFTDGSGNSAVCSFDVTVAATIDNTAPVISNCPSDISVSISSGSAGVAVTWTVPTATDNSGSVSSASTANPGDFFPVGTTTVSYTFTDGSGNSAVCSFDVTVAATIDNTAPVISNCPSDISVSIASGSSGVAVTWTVPTATDNSGSVSSSSTANPGDFFPVGTTTVSYTFTDGSGNSAVCSFDVTVAATIDNTAPVISNCPSDISVSIASGSAGVAVTWTVPTATDNSGSVSSASTANPGDFFPVGTTTVSYTFTDGSGNSAVCSFAVTVSGNVDNTSPVISGCPSDITVSTTLNGNPVAVTWTEPTATDDSGSVTTTQSANPGDSFNVGSTTVTYTFSDAAGNTAVCSFDVIVVATIDNTVPVISNCPSDIAVQTTLDGSAVAVTWTEPTATDDSGSVTSASTASPGDSFPVGITTVTYTFSDGSGNSAVCSFSVTVSATVDNTPPVISGCPSDISVQTTLGGAAVAVTWTEPTAVDDSGSVSVASTASPGDSFNVGSTLVIYTFTDGSGNAAVCTFTVTVSATVDNTPPVISGCPSDISVQTTLGGAAVAVTWTEPTAVDDSGSVSVASTASPGDSFNVGSTLVIYTFTDGSGNAAVCTFTVTVSATIDNTPPVISGCPSDISVQTTLGGAAVAVTWTEPTAVDDSGSVSVASTASPGDSFNVGSTLVIYTFTDGSGNAAVCTFTVTVSATIDNTPPVISDCPDDITVQTTLGGATVGVTWAEPTAVDDSGFVTSSSTAAPGDSFGVGATTVTYTFSDGSGNVAVCEFTVTVAATIDNTAPVVTNCPSDITVATTLDGSPVSVSWTEPTATDDSGNPVITTSTSSPGDSFAVGATTVTYTFADDSGNAAVCTFDIIVVATVDNTAPVVTNCPNDITVATTLDGAAVAVTWTEPTAVDDSGLPVTTTSTSAPGDSFLLGTTTIVYTFTDGSGNTAVCTFDVTVTATIDNTAPVVTNCPNDITVATTLDGAAVAVTWTEPTAVDDSGLPITTTSTSAPGDSFPVGTTTIVYTFTDDSGNTAVCAFDVTVTATIDNAAPVVTNCPNDITVATTLGGAAVAVTWTEPTAVDDSGLPVTTTSTSAPGDSFPVGTTTIVYTFTDGSGNTAVCAFDVTVTATIDNAAPVVTNCPNDITVATTLDGAAVAVTWTEPTAVDDSALPPATTSSSLPGDSFPVGTTTVVYTFTDGSGNTAVCAFDITVTATIDNTPPVISNCPGDITVQTSLGGDSATVTWQEPTAVDDSGSVTSTSTTSPGSSFPVGTTTVVYTFTDGSGNTAVCTFAVIVQATIDVTAPVIFGCPTDISANSVSNNNQVTVTWLEPTAVDDSGSVSSVVSTSSPGDPFFIGVTTVTYTFADAAGNTATCTFSVTVVDTSAPVISNCPNDIVVSVPFGTSSTTVTWTVPTATDNSGGGVTVSANASPGDTFLAGVTQVTYTFTDENSNSAVCSFNVIIPVEGDITPPVIAGCPNNIVVASDGNFNGATVTWTEPTAVDNSGDVPTVDRTRAPGSLFPIGDTAVTYTFTDAAGNMASCSFDVTVVDASAPVIANCPVDITLTVPFGTTSAVVTWTTPTATDNSGGVVTSTNTASPGDVFPVGLTQVLYTFSDNQGNSAVCSFTVLVTALGDTTIPVITGCPSDIGVTADSSLNGAFVQWTEPTATDNSGSVSSSSTASPDDFFVIGETTVTYTFTDPVGNQAFCSFNILVTDTTAPLINNCPEDISITVPFGVSSAVVTWTVPTANDNSGTSTLTSNTANPGDAFSVGSSQVVYTFSDDNGNTAVCAFNIFVNALGDTTPPVISDCPTSTIAAQADPLLPGSNVDWTEPTATDNDGNAPTVQVANGPGTFFVIGTTTVTYTFTDASGNEAVCSFDVVVIDTTAPAVTGCPEDISLNVPFGTSTTAVTWEAPIVSDNSGSFDATNNFNPGDTFPAGVSTQVTYTYTDDSNNVAVCTFLVTITIGADMTVPVIADCPADIVQILPDDASSVSVTWTVPTATDNSGATPAVTTTGNSGDFFAVGTATVTYTFTDVAGNEAVCSFIVTVVDNTPPTFLFCPSDIVLEIPLGTASAIAIWNEPVAQDNSGTATFQSQTASSGDSFAAATTTTVTYAYADDTGNVATCSFDVTVNTFDDEGPVIANCPDNIVVEVEIGVGGTPVTWAIPTATDNSGVIVTVENNFAPGDFFDVGSTLVVYTFTDNAGNQVQCAFNVAVNGVDTRPPLIQFCPDDISVTTDIVNTGATVSWDNPIVADASGDPISIVVSKASGTSFDVGTTEVMYTFVDSSGNSVSCSFLVTVVAVDDAAPVISGCPNDITRTVLTDTTGGIITWTPPVATDNSGEPVDLQNIPSLPGTFFPVGTTVVVYSFADAVGNTAECTFTITIDQDSPCNLSPCENGGVCLAQSLTNYVCVCPGCFTGVNCQIELDPCDGNTCINGGECFPQPNSCTQYYCECPECYYGEFCENRVDACACNKCENGGVCVPSSGTSCTDYSCLCTGCFVGQFCENEYNPCDFGPCQNGGICSNIADSCSAYSCECQGCFTGYSCDIAIPNPCDEDPCANGGVCSRVSGSCYAYQCACQPGFAGPRCEDAVVVLINPCNNFPCDNGGSCVCDSEGDYVCLCPPGYNGINCQSGLITVQDACASNPCLNGGNCINSYHSDSNVNGNYVPEYTCICQTGFTGINCAFTTADNPGLVVCDDSKCQNGGACFNSYYSLDQSLSYYCNCPLGFFGECCELVHPDPCASNPCQNAGNCLAFNTYFVCSCVNGFTGITCEIAPDDITAPVLLCPSDISVSATTTSGGTEVNWNVPTVTDNSGSWGFISVNSEPGVFYPIGTSLPVTYTYADADGNIATCTFVVTVTELDNILPILQDCPEDIELTLPPGGLSSAVSWLVPSATDNFGNVNVLSNFSPGDTFDLGSTLVSYIFSDDAGNSVNCDFTVTIAVEPDIDPPVINNCPGDLDIVVAPGVTESLATWIEPTAIDNVAVASVSNNFNPGTSFPLGTTVVTYSFSDAAGNPASCSFDITVSVGEDLLAPVVQNCPGNIAIFVSVGISETAVTWIEPSAVDNSAGAITVTQNYAPGDIFPIGATQVTYTFADQAGNTATCEFFVGLSVAVDNEAPIISNCPGDITLNVDAEVTQVTASWSPPTAVDNSGSFNTVSNFVPGDVFSLGATGVIYTFTDLSGNDAVCAFNIIVTVAADVVPPEISNCAGDISVEVSASVASATVSWLEPTAVDNSGVVFTSQTAAPGQVFPIGTSTVTYTFTDQAGNMAICSFVVTVTAIDDIAPVIIGCPNMITYEAPLGFTSAPVVWNEPTALEGNVVVTQTNSPGSQFPRGTTQVTYTFTDAAGNSASCTFTVIVTIAVDVTRPVISGCPDDVDVRVDVGVTAGAASWVAPTAVDDSGVVNVANNFNSGDLFSVGTTIVTYTFSDAEGNSATCSFLVTVVAEADNIAPVITGCPDDVFLFVPLGTTRANVFWTEPTATDNFGDVSVSQSSTPGSLFALGQSSVTYTFVDEANNVAFCSFDVFVLVRDADDVAPVVTACPGDITVNTPDSNTAVVASWPVPRAIDNSGVVNVVATNVPGDSFPLGITTVTYTFTDDSGNSATCVFDVNVVIGAIDTTIPVVNGCPTDFEVLTPEGSTSEVVTWTEPQAFDNSGSVAVTQSHRPGDLFNLGTTQVVYQFSDPSGNDAFCIFIVTVSELIIVDNTPPVITDCPADIQLTVPENIATVTAVWQEPTADDESLPIASIQNFLSGDQFPVGVTTVVYTFTDAAGNSAVCSFDVTVIAIPVDNTPPVISNCPSDISLSVPAGIDNVAVTWTEPTATDETSPVIVTQTASPADVFPVGQTSIVTYTFSDAAGNVAVCSFQVSVTATTVDTTAPVISNCPSDISLTVGAGVTSIPLSWTEPSAVDETSAVTVTQTHAPGNSFGLGQTTVVYTFSDAAGNVAICAFDVIISATTVDNTAPVISNCPSDISLTVGTGVTSVPVTWTEPSAVDETSAVTVTRSSVPGDSFGLGTTTVLYTFTDASENTAVCSFDITITVTAVDNTPPTIAGCPMDVSIVLPAGTVGTEVGWVEPTATDAEGAVTGSSNLSPGDTFPLGSTTVVYTFTDAAGNTATCTFVVTLVASVVDNTAPVISNCPNDISLTVGAGVTSVPVSWTEPSAVDETSAVTVTQSSTPGSSFGLGQTQVSYVFSDASGNNAFCIFTITITAQATGDTTPPVISGCPDDISLVVSGSTTSAAVSWTEPTAVDETSAVTVTQTATPGTTFAVGTSTSVVYTFTDAAGNSAICQFTVTLATANTDNTAPVISNCPSDITTFVASGTTSSAVSWIEPTAVDFVSAVTTTRTAAPGTAFPVGTSQVTYTFSDASGNAATCSFLVTVATAGTGDTTAPVISNCPSDITVSDINLDGTQAAFWVEPTATDNSAVTVSQTASPGDSFILGDTTVTYTFTDTSNNQAVCQFVVTVTESTPCDSNPCQANEQCFYSADTFLCLPAGRKRREADSMMTEDCPCENGGLCQEDSNGDSFCLCEPGFRGPLCEHAVEIADPCHPNPCVNNGTCHLTPRGTTVAFVCDCAAGWYGRFCEKSGVELLSDNDQRLVRMGERALRRIVADQEQMSWAFLAGCLLLVVTVITLLVGLLCLVPRLRTIRTGKAALDEVTLVQ